MISISPELQIVLSAGLWHGAMVFLRVAALVSLLPAFGDRSVPARVKLGLSVAFTMIVAPAIPAIPAPESVIAMAGFAASEVGIGLALGFGIRVFVLVLQTAGSIAAQSTSLSQILGGAGVEPVPAIGFVLVAGGMALAVMAGLHMRAAAFLIASYDLLPFATVPDGGQMSQWGLRQVSQGFSLAFLLAAPFVIASVIYNLTLGVINRAMPQLMVAFVGAPVITFGGLFLLFISAPTMLAVWEDALAMFLQNPTGIVR
jgi:flagellar biosynthesis protein FliR